MRQTVGFRRVLLIPMIGVCCFLFPTAAAAVCHGDACLVIENVRHGHRCGNSPDSVEADYRNDSPTEYLRGYVVIDTPDRGTIYIPTGLLSPDQGKTGGPAYACHASSLSPTGIARTGSNPNALQYPPGH